MVTLVYKLHSYDADNNPLYYAEYCGKSTESKPTAGLISGSKFIEVNTGKTYVFDGLSTPKAWAELVVKTAAAT